MSQSSSADPAAHPAVRLATGVNARWRALPAAQRRCYRAITGGFVAFLLFVGLLPLARGSWVAALSAPVGALLGWGAPVALLGALTTCSLIVSDAFTGSTRVRGRVLWCLGCALALLLAASRLALGGATGGVWGALGAQLLRHFTLPVQQLILWGGLGLDLLVLFRVSWGDLTHLWHRSASPHTFMLSPRQPHGTALAAAADLAAPDHSPTSLTVQAPTTAPLTTRTTLTPRNGLTWPTSVDPPANPAPDPLVGLVDTPPYAGASVAPPPLDFTGDALLDALRVPAYLRQGMTLAGAQPALPPLPAPAPNSLPSFAGAGEPVLPPALPSSRRSTRTLRHENPAPQQRMAREVQAAWADRQVPHSRAATGGKHAWALPPLDLLHPVPAAAQVDLRAHAAKLAELLARTLKSLGVEAEVRPGDISIGPTVIRFGVRPLERPRIDERGRVQVAADGTPITVRPRVSHIMSLRDDLALALAVKTLRMEAPVPERPYVGIEMPNAYARTVTLREILVSREFRAAAGHMPLPLALGRDVAGQVRVGDLARWPHLLIAGATGAGKSVCLHAIIGTLITQATPDYLRLLLIDPKIVELTRYAGLPHLLAPVISAPQAAAAALAEVLAEMERRYHLFAQVGVRNIDGYAARRAADQDGDLAGLPRIVIIIEELADLLLLGGDAVARTICRLAQRARATGIHLVVATQRPSVDVITDQIKANIPARIAFMVASAVDARTILDHSGAEHLLGRGDMLFQPGDAPTAERIQGAYITEDEIARLVHFWAAQAPAQHAPPAAPDDLAYLWSRPQRAIPARERR